MACRTCRFLDVLENKAGKRVARKDMAYRCTVIIPELHLPASVRKPTISKKWMSPDEGKDCTFHKPIEGSETK